MAWILLFYFATMISFLFDDSNSRAHLKEIVMRGILGIVSLVFVLSILNNTISAADSATEPGLGTIEKKDNTTYDGLDVKKQAMPTIGDSSATTPSEGECRRYRESRESLRTLTINPNQAVNLSPVSAREQWCMDAAREAALQREQEQQCSAVEFNLRVLYERDMTNAQNIRQNTSEFEYLNNPRPECAMASAAYRRYSQAMINHAMCGAWYNVLIFRTCADELVQETERLAEYSRQLELCQDAVSLAVRSTPSSDYCNALSAYNNQCSGRSLPTSLSAYSEACR